MKGVEMELKYCTHKANRGFNMLTLDTIHCCANLLPHLLQI